MKRAAFVVGGGAVSPFGIGLSALFEGVWSGAVAVRPPRRLKGGTGSDAPIAEFPADVVAAAGGPNGLAFGTARLAAEEALGSIGTVERRATGIVLATTKADLGGVEGPGDGLGSPGALLARLRSALGCEGPAVAASAACASGVVALGTAGRWIAEGRCDRALVVGVDVLWEFVVRGFGALLAVDPAGCRPFDVARRGTSCGEAAAALLLSDNPGRAGAPRLIGWGGANEAHHMTAPNRDGVGVRRAAGRALAMAGVGLADVSCVHLHGTGTVYNDAAEAKGLAELFAPAGRTPPAFGSKGQLGHSMGAAGVVESLVAVEALRRGEIAGNAGLVRTDVDPRLDVASGPRRFPRMEIALKVTAGFGGVSAAAVFRK